MGRRLSTGGQAAALGGSRRAERFVELREKFDVFFGGGRG